MLAQARPLMIINHLTSYLVLNWIIANELIQIGLLTSVSLKLDQIVRGLMDDNCLGIPLAILPTCSMNPETAVTCNRCHFNQELFAVYLTICI